MNLYSYYKFKTDKVISLDIGQKTYYNITMTLNEKLTIEFQPFDKEVVDFYNLLCKKMGWKIVKRFSSIYFCYPNVTDRDESVWFINECSLNTDIERRYGCSYIVINDNSVVEHFLYNYTKAIDDKSNRIVFLKTTNGYEQYGTFEFVETKSQIVGKLKIYTQKFINE